MPTETFKRVMPDPSTVARVSPRSIGELMRSLDEYIKNEEEVRRMYPWADRFVCGMPLASWQRQAVWSEAQQIRFIDSIWRKLDLGSYMVNAWWETDNEVMAPLSDIVIDGQQRLTAIERYVKGEIPAVAKDGCFVFFHELEPHEQMGFKNRIFARAEMETKDEAVLREAHDLREFGGVAHTEDQRAVQRVKP